MMTMRRSTITVGAASALIAILALIFLDGRAVRAQADAVEPMTASQRAALLTTGATVDPAMWSEYIVGVENARAVAAEIGRTIPLPASGTFSDLKWQVAEVGVTRAEIQAVMEFNALCDWERAITDRGKASATELSVLELVPSWPSFRQQEQAVVVDRMVDALRRGDLAPLRAHMAANCVF